MTKASTHSGAGAHRKLEHIDIELTRLCNLECIHCSTGLAGTGRELSFDEITEILQEAQLLGLEKVGLTGGEPFLRKRKLRELMRFCIDQLGIPVHVHTNGTLISSREAEEIKQLGVEITVSLYGSNPKTHDSITQIEGSLKSTLNGLRKLLRTGTNVFVYTVPMKINLHEIIPLMRMTSKIGCKRVRILTLSPTGRAIENFNKFALDDEEVSWLNKEISEAQKEIDVELYAGFRTRQLYPELKMLPGHYSCLAAENRIHIDAFGNVFPCTASSGRLVFSAGNLQMSGSTLSEIWHYSPLFQFIREFHSNPPEKCRGCGLYQDCMSGCRVMMSYKYGDVTIADPQCKGPIIV